MLNSIQTIIDIDYMPPPCNLARGLTNVTMVPLTLSGSGHACYSASCLVQCHQEKEYMPMARLWTQHSLAPS